MDTIQIGAWLDDEFLLQIGAVAVNPDVDAWPDVTIDDLGVAVYVRAPLCGVVALEVVVDAWAKAFSLDLRAANSPHEVLRKDRSVEPPRWRLGGFKCDRRRERAQDVRGRARRGRPGYPRRTFRRPGRVEASAGSR